ncbi:MAG: GDP-L-fucose synthase [Verrucomicrobiota bacterium JB024]|nr:GDP-L-fucose synthase [Verrucomicrobiota bacterium JB024]
MDSTTKVFLSGHRGMVGSAIHRALLAQGHENFVLRTHAELDLCDAAAVEETLADEKPEVVIVAAARVGGIHANNTYPAEFIHENLASAHNLIHFSWKHGVKRLLFLGSSCIYPREAPQPMTEDCLLSGPLEPTNEPYAIAKIAGLKLCQYYRKQYGVLYHSGMPTNLYGPGDNYHPENSHVLPALLRRFHEAVEAGAPDVTLWGTGSPLREFLHVDDLAAASLHLLALDNPPDWVNVGFGSDVTIKELAETVRDVTGFKGELKWDTSKPDGTPRKLMDSSTIRATGWEPKISLREGIEKTYAAFVQELATGKLRG